MADIDIPSPQHRATKSQMDGGAQNVTSFSGKHCMEGNQVDIDLLKKGSVLEKDFRPPTKTPTPHPPSEKCAKLKYCYYYIVTSLKRLG